MGIESHIHTNLTPAAHTTYESGNPIQITTIIYTESLDRSSRRSRLSGPIERSTGCTVLLVRGGGVFFAVGPEGGDFEEHAEEGEDAACY